MSSFLPLHSKLFLYKNRLINYLSEVRLNQHFKALKQLPTRNKKNYGYLHAMVNTLHQGHYRKVYNTFSIF